MKLRNFIFVLLLFSSFYGCKKDIYSLIGSPLAREVSTEFDRVPGLECAMTDTIFTFEDGFLSFSEEHILCVDVKMGNEDFNTMRYESRFGPRADSGNAGLVIATFLDLIRQCDVPWPDYYNWYECDMTIDGMFMSNVGVRKKGFLGSIFSDAPSIKIKTDKFVPNQRFGKSRNITLNNNREDASRIRMLYNLKVFEKMGYPAPRSNLANVQINGELLGAYTHLEAIDEDFLIRVFGNSDGDLYEGQLADFYEKNVTRWEPKSTNTDLNYGPIRNIARVIKEVDDENLINQLGLYLDIDQFIDFWVLEAFLQHEDGYTSNRNNFLVYFDPANSDRATFIPWGLNYEHSVNPDFSLENYIAAYIPRRLSRIPEASEKFEERMNFLLNEIWDEAELLELVDSYALQVRSAQADPDYNRSISDLKGWIINRRNQIETILEDGLPIGDEGVSNNCL